MAARDAVDKSRDWVTLAEAIAEEENIMDDIDAESEELGGQRTFFAGDFAHYGWPQLVRAGLGGHETLNLYAEAITRMPENPGIPLCPTATRRLCAPFSRLIPTTRATVR